MDVKATKVMALMVMALFCVGAFAAVFVTDENSSAATVTQKMYVEQVGADGKVTDSQWLIYEFDGTVTDFVAKANAALDSVGLGKLVFSYTSGDYVSGKWDGSSNIATYVAKDGNWSKTDKTAQEYPAATAIGVATGGWISKTLYESMTAADKAKYTVDGTMGDTWYAIKILDKKPTDAPEVKTYHILAKHFDAKGKVDKSEWITFDSLQDNRSYIAKANAAFKDKGWDKVSLSYQWGGVSMSYDGSSSNSADYAKDGKWEHVSDTSTEYINNSEVCMAFGGYITNALYDTLTDAEKENWIFDFKYEETSYYYAKITDSTNGWEQKSNITLYIVIGVVAVIAIVAIAFFVIKKK